jgi:hypothetical protein
MVPQDLYNKYASVIFGTPSASYALGPVGENRSTTGYNFGVGGANGSAPFGIKF